MDKVKRMLFKVLSRTLSLEDFEAWLYNDNFVADNILKNEVILELLSINLRSKHAMHELEKFCSLYFEQEEYLVEIVKYNCQVLLKDHSDNAVENMINNISLFYDLEDDYFLISQIYWFGEEWSLAMDGYYSKNEAKGHLLDFIEAVLTKLSSKNKAEIVKTLHEGVK